jgi:hypothetical protein
MSGGITTGVTSQGPWEAQAAPLKRGMARAESLYKAGPAPYFPGKTLAGFDPAQQAAQAATMGYALGPRPAVQQSLAERQMGRTYDWASKIPEMAAQGLGAVGPDLQNIMGGEVDYDTGPFNKMAKAYKDQVVSQLGGTQGALANIRSGLVNYGQAGGSTRGDLMQKEAIEKAVTEGLAMPLAQQYGQAYQQAQAGRLPAAQAIQQGYGGIGSAYGQAAQTGLAGVQQYPGIMAAPLSMYGAMGDVGDQRRALAQESINQAMTKYNYGANAGQTALQNFMAGISGEYGGVQKQTPSALQSMGQLGSLMTGLKAGFG